MESKIILFTAVILTVLFIGCSKLPATSPQTTPKKTIPVVGNTVSIVSTDATLKKAISSEGTWIIAITKNLTFNRNLIVDGDYKMVKKMLVVTIS